MFSQHETIFFFHLIGHFESTCLWVDSECPTFFLARRFFILTLVNILMFFPTWNYILFSAYWAFRVYLSLSGFGMPYFFLAHRFFILALVNILMFFQTWHYYRFQFIVHFVSTHLWVDFWIVIFLFQHLLKCWYSSELETITFPDYIAFHVYSYLRGCGMPYFFGPSIFHFITCWYFDVFPKMKLSSSSFYWAILQFMMFFIA